MSIANSHTKPRICTVSYCQYKRCQMGRRWLECGVLYTTSSDHTFRVWDGRRENNFIFWKNMHIGSPFLLSTWISCFVIDHSITPESVHHQTKKLKYMLSKDALQWYHERRAGSKTKPFKWSSILDRFPPMVCGQLVLGGIVQCDHRFAQVLGSWANV